MEFSILTCLSYASLFNALCLEPFQIRNKAIYWGPHSLLYTVVMKESSNLLQGFVYLFSYWIADYHFVLSISVLHAFIVNGRLHSSWLICSSASLLLLIVWAIVAWILDLCYFKHAFHCLSSVTLSHMREAKCIC